MAGIVAILSIIDLFWKNRYRDEMKRMSTAGERLARYFSPQVTSARRFNLRPNKSSNGGVTVVGGGVEHCRPDYLIDRPGFPFPIVEFVAEGAGRLVMNDRWHDLIPGTLFTYGHGVAHAISCDEEHALVKYFLVLGGRGSPAYLRSLRLGIGSVVQVADPGRVRHILDDIIDFGLSDRFDREDCCLQALRYLMLKITDSVIPLPASSARAFHTYQRCRNYIETNGLTVTSLRSVAEACHVDEAYLCRLFRRFGRERPFHYLQHIRMNHAMTQLQTTDRLVKEIAEDLHFSDTANFTRAFRSWYGVPPNAIRRMNLG